MDIDAVKPGMKGYGLTVFRGTKVDTFEFEVIDVMKKNVAKGDVILARLSGDVVDEAGVISGMSGSPVYIDDKLVGALAFSYGAFTKEPLAGITPIGEMLEPPNVQYKQPRGSFSPMKITLNCPGLDEEILKELTERVPSFDMVQSQGSGGIMEDSLLPYPGSPLTVILVEGDTYWFASGTCTHREGEKVWGWGHSMATLGETELPMAAGYVYYVVPSEWSSFKLSAPTKIIGTIKNDNERGVIGIIGEIPEMVEFDLEIRGEDFHYRIMKEKVFLPYLFWGLTSYSIATSYKVPGDVTMQVYLEVKGTRNFQFENLYTGTTGETTKYLWELFEFIQNNPFEKVDIKEIKLKLIPTDKIKIARIEAIWIEKDILEPGDSLDILVSLLTYQEGLVKKRISIKLPDRVEKGELQIEVESGRLARENDLYNITTIEGLLRWLSEAPKNNELVVTLTQEGRSGWIEGEEFPALPLSMEPFIRNKSKDEREVLVKRITMPWVIIGDESRELEIK